MKRQKYEPISENTVKLILAMNDKVLNTEAGRMLNISDSSVGNVRIVKRLIMQSDFNGLRKRFFSNSQTSADLIGWISKELRIAVPEWVTKTEREEVPEPVVPADPIDIPEESVKQVEIVQTPDRNSEVLEEIRITNQFLKELLKCTKELAGSLKEMHDHMNEDMDMLIRSNDEGFRDLRETVTTSGKHISAAIFNQKKEKGASR